MSIRLYREYDNEGNLIKLECSKCGEIKEVGDYRIIENDNIEV